MAGIAVDSARIPGEWKRSLRGGGSAVTRTKTNVAGLDPGRVGFMPEMTTHVTGLPQSGFCRKCG